MEYTYSYFVTQNLQKSTTTFQFREKENISQIKKMAGNKSYK